MRKKAEAPREWSPHDVAILHTRDILDRSLNDAIHSRPANPVSFRTAYGTDEKVLVSGDYQLCTFRGIGDGSYVHTSGVLLARGPGALAATTMFAVGQAIGNGSRRAAAQANAASRWAVDEMGSLYVSTHGFYLHSRTGLAPWCWGPIASMELVGPRIVQLQGQSNNGPVSWQIRSDWAELLLVLWALNENPSHPQLRQWIPPGWEERYAERVLTDSTPSRPRLRARIARTAEQTR